MKDSFFKEEKKKKRLLYNHKMRMKTDSAQDKACNVIKAVKNDIMNTVTFKHKEVWELVLQLYLVIKFLIHSSNENSKTSTCHHNIFEKNKMNKQSITKLCTRRWGQPVSVRLAWWGTGSEGGSPVSPSRTWLENSGVAVGIQSCTWSLKKSNSWIKDKRIRKKAKLPNSANLVLSVSKLSGQYDLKKVTDFPWEPANWNTTRF